MIIVCFHGAYGICLANAHGDQKIYAIIEFAKSRACEEHFHKNFHIMHFQKFFK